jgi:16S rRNA (adenine1518-N6/adenine1519-N6)-dimethyltransferase
MNVHRLLDQWGIRPKKSLGQNFLWDDTVAQRIVASAEIEPGERVLEIGPGAGALTQHLAEVSGEVIAIELDLRLVEMLNSLFGDHVNVTVVHGDILKVKLSDAVGGPDFSFKVIGNLPYYISSAVLRHLLEVSPKPRSITVTVQREVAERIVAKPGDMSLLAVSVQFFGRPTLLFRVKPGSFYPSPKVTSAVVRIDLDESPRYPTDPLAFFRVVRAGFSQRRKQLRNALAGSLGQSPFEVEARLLKCDLDPQRRAQTLSLDEWCQATRALQGIEGDAGA